MNRKVAQSYVWHAEKAFFVSTIDRESSAALAPGLVYSETFAWEWDPETRERGDIVGQAEGFAGDVTVHLDVVRSLRRTGRMPREDGDD
jgi:hypothetical protein